MPDKFVIASAASSSEMSLVDPAIVAKLLPKDEKLSGKLKIKKSLAKASKPKDVVSSRKATLDHPHPKLFDIDLFSDEREKYRNESKCFSSFPAR